MIELLLAQALNFTQVEAPMFGTAPASIVRECVAEAGVSKADDLITDSHFEIYEGCMIQYLGEV